MPFIEEEKYQQLQKSIEDANLKVEQAELKVEETELEVEELEESFNNLKQKSRTINIVLIILLLIAAAIIYLFKSGTFSSNSTPKIDVATIKAKEAQRVIDSIQRLQADNFTQEEYPEENLDDNIQNISDNTKGQTVYSVQIGAFSTKKYPLLSSKIIAGTSSYRNEYYKYSVGLFSTVKEARNLRNELIRIGFEDAFIASYKNGKRKQIHD